MSAVMQPDLRDQARAQPPAWAGEKIQRWDEPRARALAAFVTRDYWTDQGSINVFRVIGTEHIDYQGLSWLEFLERGKRMDQNLALHAANPGYYRETGRKVPGMYYRSLDGLSWYVGADGNHRTCLARFDFHGRGQTMLHGVTLSHTVADLELFVLYERLREVCLERRLGERIEPHRELLRREDTAGWKLDHTLVSLQMSAPDGDTRLLDAQAARAQLRALEAPPRRRWWRIAG